MAGRLRGVPDPMIGTNAFLLVLRRALTSCPVGRLVTPVVGGHDEARRSGLRRCLAPKLPRSAHQQETDGSAARSVDGGCDLSCRLIVFDAGRRGEGQLELDGREPAKRALAAATVVGVLDPHDGLVGELAAGPPAAAVEHVLLE